MNKKFLLIFLLFAFWVSTSALQAITYVPLWMLGESFGLGLYKGNAVYSASGEASKQLPLDAAATSLTLASGTCGYAVAEVTGKLESTNSMCHVRLSWAFEMLDNTYSVVGNPASITDQLNAATWSVILGTDGNLYASGTPGTLWQVKKLEIGGL